MNANDNTPPSGPKARKARKARKGKERSCPICGKPRDPLYDPFCSRRCADVDLHRWFTGGYAIPGERVTPEPDDEDK